MIPAVLLAFALHTDVGGPAQSLPHSYAKTAAAPAPSAPKAEPQAYGMYDSTMPGKLPAGQSQAVYANGLYAASSQDSQGHPHTLWIDVTGTNASAEVLDVEPYDAHWWDAGPWAAAAHKNHPNLPVVVYTASDTWAAAKQSVAQYAPGVNVKWWVASPSGVPHLVPGSDATQWLWGKNYNVSETAPDFWTP